ncbi:MAG: hypothetical protein QOJ59_1781 [Thermomicrobiales bacterium]|nr:hypothetical protein [Thermomicrobiales bacterium]
MDGHRFDDVTRLFAAGLPRRRFLRAALGALAGAAATAIRPGQTGAACGTRCRHQCSLGCSSLPSRQRLACRRACIGCDGDFERVCFAQGPFGPVDLTCCPEGTFCVFGAGVCCNEGADVCFGEDGPFCCPGGTFCNFETGQCEPPAECGAESGCFGGICGLGCFCVSSVEDVGACIKGEFANCGGDPCVASADCGEGGLCVDVTSDQCCPGGPSERVCVPAEAICDRGGGVGVREAGTAPGWHR